MLRTPTPPLGEICGRIGTPVCRASRATVRCASARTRGSLAPAPDSEMLKFESMRTLPWPTFTEAGQGIKGKAPGPGWDCASNRGVIKRGRMKRIIEKDSKLKNYQTRSQRAVGPA